MMITIISTMTFAVDTLAACVSFNVLVSCCMISFWSSSRFDAAAGFVGPSWLCCCCWCLPFSTRLLSVYWATFACYPSYVAHSSPLQAPYYSLARKCSVSFAIEYCRYLWLLAGMYLASPCCWNFTLSRVNWSLVVGEWKGKSTNWYGVCSIQMTNDQVACDFNVTQFQHLLSISRLASD